MIATSVKVYGQEKPPRPITVTVHLVQNLSFGTFYQGSTGGSVIISPTGSRSSTGDIVLLTGAFSEGLFDVVGNPGTIVSLLDGPDGTLNGSNGGTLTVNIRNTDMLHPFIITTVPPSATVLSIGGTLYVGTPPGNPPGIYSGTFTLTFVQE